VDARSMTNDETGDVTRWLRTARTRLSVLATTLTILSIRRPRPQRSLPKPLIGVAHSSDRLSLTLAGAVVPSLSSSLFIPCFIQQSASNRRSSKLDVIGRSSQTQLPRAKPLESLDMSR